MLHKIILFTLPLVLSAMKSDNGKWNSVNSRILGGNSIEPHSRSFQVALYLRVGTTGELGFCGGSLVHPQWVITAAHCCYHGDMLVDNGQAILGAHSLYDRYENGRRIINVAKIEVHPEWDATTFANDLALLQLANIAQMTDTVSTVRLPYLSITSSNFAGSAATVSGWGIAAPGITFVSPTLRSKVMTVMIDPLCNSYYSSLLPDNTICGFNGQSGTCRGDNGGPMTIFYNATEEVILIGVASFVDASGCNEEVPSVFTRTQRYLQWIRDVTDIVLD